MYFNLPPKYTFALWFWGRCEHYSVLINFSRSKWKKKLFCSVCYKIVVFQHNIKSNYNQCGTWKKRYVSVIFLRFSFGTSLVINYSQSTHLPPPDLTSYRIHIPCSKSSSNNRAGRRLTPRDSGTRILRTFQFFFFA